MQKLAGVITESQYKKLTEQQLEESWKDWLAGGLIALSTLAGVGKVVQMDREAAEDKEQKQEYFDNVLAKAVQASQASDSKDLVTLANQLIDAKKIERPTIQPGNTAEENNTIFSRAAESYMRNNPQEFSVSLDGKTIMWTPKATT